MDDDDRRARYQRKIDLAEESLVYYDAELDRDPKFGDVFATSGYRVDTVPVDGFQHGCTIDWGLIDVVPSRIGNNEVRMSPSPLWRPIGH